MSEQIGYIAFINQQNHTLFVCHPDNRPRVFADKDFAMRVALALAAEGNIIIASFEDVKKQNPNFNFGEIIIEHEG